MIKRWLLLLVWLLPKLAFADAISNFSALTLTPPSSDLSLLYLGDMFGNVDNVLAGSGSQLLGALFGVYNSAVLVLGGIVILYIVFISILATAHEGEVLGRNWSSIWIPLRAVIGIALLVPKASGYSFVQIFMMWVITMGIGAADSMWSASMDYLGKGNSIIQPAQNASNVNGGQLLAGSATLLRSLSCMYMLQKQFSSYYNNMIANHISNPINPPPDFVADVAALIRQVQGNGSINISLPNSHYYGTDGICGSLQWQTVGLPSFMYGSNGQIKPQYIAIQQSIQNSRTQAVYQLFNGLTGAAQAIANNAGLANPISLGQIISQNPLTWGAGTLNNPSNYVLSGDTLKYPVNSYYTTMSSAMTFIDKGGHTMHEWMQSAQETGWILAGKYYYDLVSINNQFSQVADNSLPQFSGPISNFNSNSNLSSYLPSNYVTSLNSLINGSGSADVGMSGRFIKDVQTYARNQNSSAISTANGFESFAGGDMPDGVGDILGFFTAGLSNIISGFVGLATAEKNNLNPIVSLANIGSGLITLSFYTFIKAAGLLFGLAIGLGAAWGFALAVAVEVLTTVIMSMMAPLLIALIVAGLMMVFYIPLIPFIIFTFGAIGWFIAVIEAMLAAPLVALGIAHPEGQPILGKAEPAVILLVNVFMRPTFMIFGLLIGIQLSYVGVWLLNRGFWGAYVDYAIQGIQNPVVWIFFPVAILMIYVLMIQQLLQKSFSLIYLIPDEVLKWIGGNIKGLGGEAQAEQAVASSTASGMETQAKVMGAIPEPAAKAGAKMDEHGKEADELKNALKVSGSSSDSGGGSTVTSTPGAAGGGASGGAPSGGAGSSGVGSQSGNTAGQPGVNITSNASSTANKKSTDSSDL